MTRCSYPPRASWDEAWKRYAAGVFHKMGQEARGLGGGKVRSPAVFLVSGLAFLDSPSGGAGVVARILRAFEEIRGGLDTTPSKILYSRTRLR